MEDSGQGTGHESPGRGECATRCWVDTGRHTECGSGTHNIRVAPCGFDLESSATFVEPGAPLPALVVFELGLFVTPD